MSPQFGAAFNYVFEKPGGFTNMLLVTVCELIPVVGPIVSLGYRAEVAEALDRDPDLRRYPKFTFDRFVEYLMRGLWPFLVALVVSLAVYLPLLMILGAAVAASLAAKAPPEVVVPIIIGGFTLVILLLLAVVVPMVLHAQLTARFDLPGAFRFAVDFWKLVPGPAVFTIVVFFPLSIVVALLGLLVCFVGVYPANTLSQMAWEHLQMQLYREYVDRGGEPLIDYGDDPDDDGEFGGEAAEPVR